MKSQSISRTLEEYRRSDNSFEFDFLMQKISHKNRYDDYLKQQIMHKKQKVERSKTEK